MDDEQLKHLRVALDNVERGILLGANTPLDTLTEEERQRHLAALEGLRRLAGVILHTLGGHGGN
jgi:hypothetical protein